MTTKEAKGVKDRRSLVEGLSAAPVAVDPGLEKQFVFAHKATSPEPVTRSKAEDEPSAPQPAQSSLVSRVPFTTRLRADYAEALKLASLQRQISKIKPNTLQDILEEALEPWLKKNGYLTSSHQ